QAEASIKMNTGQIDAIKLQLTYCRITSPITGRVGLRLVDPGNVVKASDTGGLVVITQLEPIALVFSVPEDSLQPILRRFRPGAYVYVITPDTVVQMRPVPLRPTEGAVASVRTGVADSEALVVDGAEKVQDGARVELTVRKASPAGAPATPGAAGAPSAPPRA